MSNSYRLVSYRGKYALSFGQPAVRRSLGTNDRGLAEERAARLWATINGTKSEKVEDLWNAYVADRLPEVVDKNRFSSTWKALAPHFGYKVGSTINKADCLAYRAARQAQGRADSTIRTELEYLRACINHRYGKGNNSVWLPPASKPRAHYLTKGELEVLLDVVESPHVRLFIVLAITTGARMTALLELKWDMVDFAHGTLDLNPAGRVITNKHRVVVPINQRARLELEIAYAGRLSPFVIEYGGRPIASIKKAIRAAAARANLQCSPHVFRHSAGVWMAQANIPMQKIAQYLGHTTTRVTERVYARYSPTFQRDAAEALEF